MTLTSPPLLPRRRFVCGCCGGALLAWVPAPAGAAEEIIVPVIQEPRHHVRFENEYLRIIEVILPVGDETLFHKHTLDSVLVVGRGSRIRLQQFGSPEARIVETRTGEASFLAWQAHPLIHRAANLDDHDLTVIDCEIILSQPSRFPAPDRSAVPAYVQEIDNERVRVWRLRIEPGQSLPPIQQSGPGVRVVVAGDRFRETVQGAPDREADVHQGTFEWQPAGRARSITNTGNSPLEIVEFEVK